MPLDEPYNELLARKDRRRLATISHNAVSLEDSNTPEVCSTTNLRNDRS